MAAIRLYSLAEYMLKRKGRHSIHSPFVYDFLNNVIQDHKHYEFYERFIKARKSVLHNKNVIETVDFGAASGNKPFSTYRIQVNKLAARHMGKQKNYKLLYRMSQYFQPENILELGTSTGLSTIALAAGQNTGRIVTIEGCASISNVAESLFNRMEFNKIEMVIGNFDKVLGTTLATFKKLDFVFFDGNHRKLPTIDYFNQCLELAHENSVFVFDDIHWSDEMEEAWSHIANRKEVSLSIDLFHMGIVFFRKGVEKQHFILKY